MGYTSGSYNKRWGIPVGLLALILGLVLFGGLTSPLPAFAANQGSCGWCHGTLTNSATALGNGKNQLTDIRDNVNAPTTESSLMPQGDNGRGLHGIHMNYSSAHYAGGTQKLSRSKTTDPYRTKLSAYIDAGAPGAIQYPGGVTLSNNTAVVAARGNCGYCHAANHPLHEGGFLQWSTTSVKTGVYQITTKGFMLYTAPGRGVSYKNNIASTDGPRNGNCTRACHKGTSNANPAPWGNYTTAAIKLNCNSCHADSSGVSGSESALSGVHAAHLGSSAVIALANNTAMNAANNVSCKFCHTDNRGEGKSTKDWGPRIGAKAYPHATDGTEVSSDNATLTGQITSATKNGKGTTCTAACHPRSNLISAAPFNTFINWSSSMNCNMCHYYELAPSSANNSAVSAGSLPWAHGLHFGGGKVCSDCHTVPGNTAHVTFLPVTSIGVKVLSSIGYTKTSGTGTDVTVTGIDGTCTNSCHPSGSGLWSTTSSVNGCATCHQYPGAGATLATGGKGDWTDTSNGHTVRLSSNNLQTYTHLSNSSSDYNYQNDDYATVTNAVTGANKCGLCHSGGAHQNGRVDKRPNANTAYGYDGVSTFSIVSSATAPTMTCSNVVCHSATPPPTC